MAIAYFFVMNVNFLKSQGDKYYFTEIYILIGIPFLNDKKYRLIKKTER